MIKNKLFIIILGIFLINFISANGLILTNSTFNVNKTGAESKIFDIEIKNTEPYSFYNLTFETNSYLYIDRVSELKSGESKNISVSVIGNSDFNGEIRLKGFYVNDLGQQTPITYDSYLSYNSNSDTYNLDKCDMSILINDKVNWWNDADTSIRLIKYPENTPISGAEIQVNDSFNKEFNQIQTFQYYIAIASFPITPICSINVLDNVGLINDPNLDAIINLNLDFFSEPTNINVVALQKNYSINIGESNGGSLTIINTGDKIANIKLSNEWFIFSENNFDLDIGKTKGITYNIIPSFSLTTNETNTTHQQKVLIEGNFPTQELLFSIFIPYSSINTDGSLNDKCSEFDKDCLTYLENVFCPKFPTSFLCSQDPIVEKIYINNISDAMWNATFQGKNLLDAFRAIETMKRDSISTSNLVKENTAKGEELELKILNELENIRVNLLKDRDNKSNIISFILITLFSLITIGIGGYIAYNYKYKRHQKEQNRW